MNSITTLADSLNKLRVIPRLLTGCYGLMMYDVVTWYMSLPDPSNAQAAFVSTIIGAAAAFFKFYVDSGNTRNISE